MHCCNAHARVCVFQVVSQQAELQRMAAEMMRWRSAMSMLAGPPAAEEPRMPRTAPDTVPDTAPPSAPAPDGTALSGLTGAGSRVLAVRACRF